MSKLTEKRTPYELLFRWDESGNLKGAHVAWLDTVFKDGEKISQTPSGVESVEVAGNNGYPLSDIIGQVHIDSIKEIESLNLQKNNLISENNILNNNVSGLISENEALKNERDILLQEKESFKNQST